MHDAGVCSDAFVHSACMFGCKVMGVSVYLVAITSFDRDMTVFRRYKNREKIETSETREEFSKYVVYRLLG
jgi:hypothetical protein